MDINTIIIGHNEGASVQRMFRSLKDFGNTRRTWVLDRCSDNSVEQLSALDEWYLCTPSSFGQEMDFQTKTLLKGQMQGRKTSFCRNLGLSASGTKGDVIFLDGDRHIVSGTAEDLERDKINLFVLEEDTRKWWTNEQFKQKHYGHVINGFYSCGLYFPRNYIERIIDFQGGELFRTDIQDVWGLEDTYLGDVCYHLGLDCIINKKIVLSGKFGRTELDDGSLVRRFKLRNNLNVIW